VTESNVSIDSMDRHDRSSTYRRLIAESVNQLSQGVIPRVKITITSEIYNIGLIYHYINLLERSGQTNALRHYKSGQVNKSMVGVDYWKRWNPEVLWINFQLFISNFFRLYDIFLATHFPFIKGHLKIAEDDTTLVAVFRFSGQGKPYVELFFMRSLENRENENQIHCFRQGDPAIPIDVSAFRDGGKRFIVDGAEHIPIKMMVWPLNFMFDHSPTYKLLKDFVCRDVKSYISASIKD
jgi:hypothetical protein